MIFTAGKSYFMNFHSNFPYVSYIRKSLWSYDQSIVLCFLYTNILLSILMLTLCNTTLVFSKVPQKKGNIIKPGDSFSKFITVWTTLAKGPTEFCFCWVFWRCLLIFRERQEGRERETLMWERNIYRLPPIRALTRDWACYLGICPDGKSNPHPFGAWENVPTSRALAQGTTSRARGPRV